MLMPTIWGESLIDDFFNDFRKPARFPEPRKSFAPASVMKTDIMETENAFNLAIDLPGYGKENVQIQLKDGYMTVNAQTDSSNDEKDENGRYIRRERFYGSCSRSFYVGEDIKQDDIKASFKDGILNIVVPKKEPVPEVEENIFIPIE